MLVSRLNLIYNLPFTELKQYFIKYTETRISPTQFLYFSPQFFLTITSEKDKTIFEIQDNLSFPNNKLDLSSLSLDKVFEDIPPDKFLIDFQYSKDITLKGWLKQNKTLKNGGFTLFKRCENGITFSTISVKNNYLNFNELIQSFNKTIFSTRKELLKL